MSKLDDFKTRMGETWEKIKDSEAIQQIKARYEELDPQTKLYVNLGGVAGMMLLILITVFSGIAKVNSLKSDMNDREELIGWLQRSGDTLKQLKAQQEAMRGNKDMNSPLNTFVQSVGNGAGVNPDKIEVAAERSGRDTKDAKEFLADVKMNQVNLRQVTRLLFNLTDQGAPRNLVVRDLSIDTKNDPTGWLDVSFTVATWKAK